MVEVTDVELPVLCVVIEPGLQSFGLFFLGDVQVELQDGGAFVGEKSLEVHNVAIAAAPSLFWHEIEHAYDEDIFIVTSVED